MSTPKNYLKETGLQKSNKKSKPTRSRKESRLDKLANKIIPLMPSQDNKGKYFAYCDFQFHPGIIGYEKAKRCLKNECIYFYKIYIPKESIYPI